ncbi:MAG: dTMP kinase [Magnetovibrio sp.]|nr:dTMP kinase [Magnetovibrio sp.]
MFIAIDGIDGAGKTTLGKRLAEMLGANDVVLTKEPTDNSKWGQRLRKAAVEGRLPPDQELEYFRQDRQHHICNTISPALEKGKIVISDRYVDSTLAFQAQNPNEANKLFENLVGEILVPDVTFILLCPVEIGLDRVRKRDNDNLTQFEKVDVLNRAEKIYASRKGENYALIDASISVEETLGQAINVLKIKFSSNEIIKRAISRCDDVFANEARAIY